MSIKINIINITSRNCIIVIKQSTGRQCLSTKYTVTRMANHHRLCHASSSVNDWDVNNSHLAGTYRDTRCRPGARRSGTTAVWSMSFFRKSDRRRERFDGGICSRDGESSAKCGHVDGHHGTRRQEHVSARRRQPPRMAGSCNLPERDWSTSANADRRVYMNLNRADTETGPQLERNKTAATEAVGPRHGHGMK